MRGLFNSPDRWREMPGDVHEWLDYQQMRSSLPGMDDLLVEMIELKDHPWFLACQAHPEFLSTPRDGHPLFIGFIRAAREHKAGGRLLKEVSA